MEFLSFNFIKTNMGKFILNYFILFFTASHLYAQQQYELILDTVFQANEIYLDPLNNLYLVNDTEKSIAKCDMNLNVLKKISFNRGWDQALMDVSDPFKCILFYPGDYKIVLLDESLSIIGSYEEPELNLESAVCQFSTDVIGLFSNNVLKLKNYQDQKIIYSDPINDDRRQDVRIQSQLKHHNSYLYLLRTGIGIIRFNNLLFEDKRWLNPKIEKVDIFGDALFYLEGNQIMKSDLKTQVETLIINSSKAIHSFAVNREYLVWLEGSRLRIIRWNLN